MVDADNDGAVTYDELQKFLLNVIFGDMESFAKHRMLGKVDGLVTKTLGVNTYDRLNEQVRSCSQLAWVRKTSARISASAYERVGLQRARRREGLQVCSMTACALLCAAVFCSIVCQQDFVELVAAHKDIFTPMLALYSKLHKVFAHVSGLLAGGCTLHPISSSV
jgi:hypothetical protein